MCVRTQLSATRGDLTAAREALLKAESELLDIRSELEQVYSYISSVRVLLYIQRPHAGMYVLVVEAQAESRHALGHFFFSSGVLICILVEQAQAESTSKSSANIQLAFELREVLYCCMCVPVLLYMCPHVSTSKSSAKIQLAFELRKAFFFFASTYMCPHESKGKSSY
jgi:hypothetical protein